MKLDLLFDFEELGTKGDSALKKLKSALVRRGVQLVGKADISAVKRTSGVSYREVTLSLADSQTLMFAIKQSGDIFKIKINGKETPIKHQSDHSKALDEVLDKVEKGRAAFQKLLARAKVALPAKMKSGVTGRLKALEEKSSALDEAITAADNEITALKTQAA